MDLLKDIEQSDAKWKNRLPWKLLFSLGEQLLQRGSVSRHHHVIVKLSWLLCNLDLLGLSFNFHITYVVLNINKNELSVAQKLRHSSYRDQVFLVTVPDVLPWFLYFFVSSILHNSYFLSNILAIYLDLDNQWYILTLGLSCNNIGDGINHAILPLA